MYSGFLISVSFLVVIDHAQKPPADTGKFECVYNQPATPVKQNELVLLGQTLPLHHFAWESAMLETRAMPDVKINSSGNQSKSCVNVMLEKLKSTHESYATDSNYEQALDHLDGDNPYKEIEDKTE